jgi:hypothetical protein
MHALGKKKRNAIKEGYTESDDEDGDGGYDSDGDDDAGQEDVRKDGSKEGVDQENDGIKIIPFNMDEELQEGYDFGIGLIHSTLTIHAGTLIQI